MKLNDYDIPDEIIDDDRDSKIQKNLLDFEAHQIEYQIEMFTRIRQRSAVVVRDQNKKWDNYGDEAESQLLRRFAQDYEATIRNTIKRTEGKPYKMRSVRDIYDDLILFNSRSHYVLSKYKKKLKELGEELKKYERTTS